jgi:hypothetical protein
MSIEEENTTSFRNTVIWITAFLDEVNVNSFRNAVMWLLCHSKETSPIFLTLLFELRVVSLEEGNFPKFDIVWFEFLYQGKESDNWGELKEVTQC